VPTDVVDETGYLVGLDAFETADTITPIIGKEVLRCRLAEGARALVLCNQSSKAEGAFWGACRDEFADRMRAA